MGRKPVKKARTCDGKLDDVSRNVKIAISVIRISQWMKRAFQIAEEVTCRLHRGREEGQSFLNIVTLTQTMRHILTHMNPKDPYLY